MFFWTLLNTFEPFVYFFAFYFFYTFIFKKDFSLSQKLLFSIPLLPTLILAPSKLMLLGYNLSDCDRNAYEGIVASYGYGVEILYAFLIIIFSVIALRKLKSKEERNKTVLLTVGITAFLLSFSLGNILEVFTENWYIGQYGLFGAPIFVAFLAYLIVHYRAFNVRLIGAQALVAGLWLSVMSLLFIRSVDDIRIVTSITLIFVLIAGILLVRGVYREIEQRERIEKLARELELTNERQETLIHFIGHEVKGFLTKDAGAFAAISEGDFGAPPDGMKPFVDQALVEARRGADSVSNILKASNLKKGTVVYAKAPFDLRALVASAVEKAKSVAEQKGLTLSFTADEGVYQMNGDGAQLNDHVLRNLIDNSINYTPTGTVAVSLKRENDKFIITVKDTGVGISEEDKKRLFTEGGHGKDSQKVNVHSTGYGLYIVKQITEAHGGTVRAESEGAGKGSTFIVELPVA
ncbi:MAG: HAMP domain-containing sensor histidine kinase [Candidatus Paceibacterota bacterium]|jgi:signal transduction histidine kinase